MSSATKIARSYAEALADAAEAQDMLAAAGDDLRAFATLASESRELTALFASPAVARDDKSKVLEALLERAAPMPLVANLLRVMQRNHRMHIIGDVAEAFDREVDRRSGAVTAEVTSAAPLSDAERQLLETRLAAASGHRVRLTFATDPELIGGVVTRVGSVIYDGSVRTQLDSIRRRLSKQA